MITVLEGKISKTLDNDINLILMQIQHSGYEDFFDHQNEGSFQWFDDYKLDDYYV